MTLESWAPVLMFLALVLGLAIIVLFAIYMMRRIINDDF